MPDIFNALPGIEVPVDAIAERLAQMWIATAADGRPAPAEDDARATQINLVLHLGLNATVEDAARQFETLVRFSRRHPSRIVVLCPSRGEETAREMRAKIFGECFLGRSKSDKRCVEFVMLNYARGARPYLENQVSICLSADLPLYYWAHRFSANGRLADYRYLLGRAKRVLLDSAIAPPDALAYPWPNPEAIRDLAHARLLPVRQGIGQFLSSYEPATLVGGLRRVTVSRAEAFVAEGRALRRWLEQRIAACGADRGSVIFEETPLEPKAACGLAVCFGYGDDRRHFRWMGELPAGRAVFEADFGGGEARVATTTGLLEPERALSEAMFF